MRIRSHNIEFDPIPVGTKILLSTNIALYMLEVILYPIFTVDIIQNYCLSPAKIIHEIQTETYTINGISSLFLSNLFHLNPWTSGGMGILHIVMNMLTLFTIGKFIEKQIGSYAFICITTFFLLTVGPLQIPLAMILEFITMNYIPLLSTSQCGIGYSGILFAYFMIYLRLIPYDTINFCGFTVKKWVVPFIELLMLSILLQASFIGHLSGIIIGLIYISGIPGCFICRQKMLINMEKYFCNQISKRNDYILIPSKPKIHSSICGLYKYDISNFDEQVVSDTSDESHFEEETDGLIAL